MVRVGGVVATSGMLSNIVVSGSIVVIVSEKDKGRKL
jgi:hypothetical protein